MGGQTASDALGREIEERAGQLRQALRAQGLDGALLLFPTDVLYFSGTRQNGALWIPAEGPPTFLVRRSLARARLESRIADVRPFPPTRELAALFGAEVRRVGLTLDAVPAAQVDFWRRHLAGREIADVSGMLRQQRSVKSPFEIERQRACAERLCAVYAEVPTFLRAGMREIDLAAEFECRLRKAGNEGVSRLRAYNLELGGGVIASGVGALEPSYFDGPVAGRGLSPAAPSGASRRVIGRDEPILLDYTATMEGYIVDMTRVFVVGRLAGDLERAFQAALAIQAEVAERLRPGAVPDEIWERALRLAEEARLGDCFMGPPGEQVRFVGHGVGLELDELPVLAPGFSAPLVAGQTVAVEPKFVLPGLGAVGIENTWVVAPGGGVRLTSLADDLVRL
jgi:Xaa-Pro aminopeptidase